VEVEAEAKVVDNHVAHEVRLRFKLISTDCLNESLQCLEYPSDSIPIFKLELTGRFTTSRLAVPTQVPAVEATS